MANVTTSTTVFPPTVLPTDWSLADLQRHLGGVSLQRIKLYPPPGMATIEDALTLHDREAVICELVDGILVEKIMASYESVLAGILIQLLNNFVDEHPLGIVMGEAGAMQILPRRMRIPDVSFVSWKKFPGRKLPRDRVFAVAPDLAVEVLSEGNTDEEMDEKLDEYFRAGVRLVWYIDPETRTANVYESTDQVETQSEDGTLSGKDVLPGFELPLRTLFEKVERADK